MRQTGTLSLGRQIQVVLMSYLTRPGIRWALAAIGIGIALLAICHQAAVHKLFGPRTAIETPYIVLLLISSLTLVSGICGLLLMFFIHARFQLMGTAARIMPNTRRAGLIVAGVMIPLASFAIAKCEVWDAPASAFAVGVLNLAVLILVGYVFCRPVLLPIFIVVGLFAYRAAQQTELPYDLNQISTNFDREVAQLHAQINRPKLTETQAQHLAARISWLEQFSGKVKLLRVTIFLGDVLALIGLGLLARPVRLSSVSLAERIRRILPQPSRSENPIREQPHRRVRSQFARRLHRRLAVRDRRAGGVAALALLALGIWFNFRFRAQTGPALTFMLAFLPGALAAIGWRERWANFDFESLYPVSRREFVTDMGVGLIFEVAEFWIVSVVAVLALCICLRSGVLYDDRFRLAILCGAMMQFLWIGAIFLIGQRRQTTSFVAGLTPFVIAMFISLDALWRGDQPISLTKVVISVVVEMGIGIMMFATTWIFLQRGAASAPSVSV